jgi:hypothetical protein
MAERLGSARSPATRGKHPPCLQLRRGFRDRLRWDKSRGIGMPGKLRPEWEMDNFFCSHRCLLTEVMLVRGASVLVAPARPATLLALLSPTSATSSTPVVAGLVFLDYLNVFLRPKSNLHPADELKIRCRNLLLPDPTMQSIRPDSQKVCHLSCGIGRHL